MIVFRSAMLSIEHTYILWLIQYKLNTSILSERIEKHCESFTFYSWREIEIEIEVVNKELFSMKPFDWLLSLLFIVEAITLLLSLLLLLQLLLDVEEKSFFFKKKKKIPHIGCITKLLFVYYPIAEGELKQMKAKSGPSAIEFVLLYDAPTLLLSHVVV